MTMREVILDGGSPWGFRMHGGADTNQPLRISRVNPGSKASLKGIREGDLITTINGQSTKDVTNSEAHSLLKSAGDKLKLGLNEDWNGSPKRRSQSKYATMQASMKLAETSSGSTGSGGDATTPTTTNGAALVVSQRSTLSSTNGSLSSPTNSSDTRGATCSELMDDTVSKKGKGKKRRRNRKRHAKKSDDNVSDDYRVESPPPKVVSEEPTAAECTVEVIECDDTNLRQLLETIDVAHKSPPTTSRIITSPEKRTAKQQQRSELATYFTPVFTNPRYLDAISEEGSDLSDREPRVKIVDCRVATIAPSSSVEIVHLDDSSSSDEVANTSGTILCETSQSDVNDTNVFEVIQNQGSDDVSTTNLSNANPNNGSDNVNETNLSEVTPPNDADDDDSNGTQISDANEAAFRKEFKDVLEMQDATRSSSECSEPSENTTQCTVKYNPSLCDVAAADSNSDVTLNEPSTLKDICLQRMISLPFGQDVLQELADVSQSLEEITNNLPKLSFHLPSAKTSNNTALPPIAATDDSAPVVLSALPTEEDPKTVICLSAKQREFLDAQRQIPHEADKLLDLHNKFTHRTRAESSQIDDNKTIVTITRIETTSASNGNKLLEIIRQNKDVVTDDDDDAAETESECSGTPQQQDQEARLRARNLSEWLQLARTNLSAANRCRVADAPRRRSLPREVHIRQMQFLIEKEKEIQRQLEMLEEEKRKLTAEIWTSRKQFEPNEYRISKRGDYAIHNDKFRQEMYDEYMGQVAARQQRKHHKVIKISMHDNCNINGDHAEHDDNEIEREFMDKVRERGLKRDNSHEKSTDDEKSSGDVFVMDGDSITKTHKLPKHLREFVHNMDGEDGVWSPGQKQSFDVGELRRDVSQDSTRTEEGIPPIWTPRSAGSSPTVERKEFRPVNFESPVLSRKARTRSEVVEAPWNSGEEEVIEKRLPTSNSAPGFSLPRAQNPTITLLQKAREGQLPKGAAYIEQERARKKNESPYTSATDLVYQLRTESVSDSDSERPKKTIQARKFDGLPINKDVPMILRPEARDANMSQWYKKMYETIHKQRPNRYDDDEYVMVRYKQRRARYPYAAGYLSEPEPGAYDSDATLSDHKFATLDRRRANKENESTSQMSSSLPRNTTTVNYYVQTESSKQQQSPGKIENYTPGRSSISDTEAKKWWDEVMDIFDGWLEHHAALPSYNYLLNKAIARSHLEQQQQKRMPSVKGHLSQALKESGYESDSTLVFKRRDDNAQMLSPFEQREVYKNIQKGGDVPLHGLRKPAPERPKDDADIEYFPISPTLNRIRVHKSPKQELQCYTVTVPQQQVFSTYKRTAASATSGNIPKPPRRKSSRNNSTLRLISTMKVSKRHDSCFTATPTDNKTNVKMLRDKISSKLSPHTNKKSKSVAEKSVKVVKQPKIQQRKCCVKEARQCKTCSLSTHRKPESIVKQSDKKLPDTKVVKSDAKTVKTPTAKKLTKDAVAKRNYASNLSEKSKSTTSLDSLKSSSKSSVRSLPRTITSTPKDKDKKLKKSKKEKLNVEIVKEAKKSKTKQPTESTKITLEQLNKQKEFVQTGTFFQNLLMRDIPSPTPSIITNRTNYWLHEKPKRIVCDPTIGALKIYLNQIKPVSESKFKCMDSLRSRSASPKFVTWKEDMHERSVSLPPKLDAIHTHTPPDRLVFTQTARPIVERCFSPTPPHPTSTVRSPSSRKIKSLRDKRAAMPECLSFKQAGRFKELNKFYTELARLGELERVTTSTLELQPRKKHEDEIIDYDRWMQVRARERAEKELDNLYKQLRLKQQQHDFLFKAGDVSKWRRDLDRGLRVKEKSVENIKGEFEKMQRDEAERELKQREELIYKRGVYKPLWRGNSVVNLAHCLNERRSQSEGRPRILQSDKLLTHGVGSRIWSSLSMEQVNVLKNQLSEIYGNDRKFTKKDDKVINVSLTRDAPPSNLTVRRNSNSTLPLSEVEKQKIYQSLSKEVLERQRASYKTSLSLVLGKETRGAIAAADANVKMNEAPSPRTCYSLEMSEDDQRNKESSNDFVLVLTKDDSASHKNDINDTLEIWAQPKRPLITTKANSTSETEESMSTEGSTKTVIYNERSSSKEKIQDKVDFFENIAERDVYTPTIYKAADDVGDTLVVEKKELSQSSQDLKELYGESGLQKIISEPLSASRMIKYSPPTSPKLRSNCLNDRSRSLSEVTKLRSKFEDYYNKKYTLKPRRCTSNPEMTKKQHNNVDSLRARFEYPAKAGRGRSRFRRGGVVSPIFLRAEDRFMPHINIISKIASLYTKKPTTHSEKSRSSEELAHILGIPIGEVEKLRARFDASPDKMSLLGHMFTSSPNLHELRDIAQYLTGSWTAHKYPRREDNTRPLSPCNTALVKKRPKSTSPIIPHPKHKLASILKSQHFVHRPVARYQPGSWSPTKPSVTFQEPEDPPPPPPPKGQYNDALARSESPRKYVENEVTIHYRTPVRQEVKEALSEDELAKRQADAMRKIYEEERRRKYLQVSHSDNELHDMNSRRHTDNFIPSQKSPIPLNRYDDFMDDLSPKVKPRPRSPEPRLVARALYNFVGQSSRELTFKKGEVIFIRRQVDKNWYEGEINAMIGLFPANYVEIVPYDGVKTTTTTRKPHEGQARAKYNFIAQTHLELSLAKGELVVITRRVDNNWFEGRIGGRKGIFPVSYVEVLVDPNQSQPTKPVAAPAAHSMLLNGSSGGKESMGSHSYVPTFPTQDLGMSYRAKPIQVAGNATYGSLKKNPVDQALHIDTQNEPIPYRALYKYKPQNEDELELMEGDRVFVLEKCDDGWYVGSSERTGAFGTFPGNYVERI